MTPLDQAHLAAEADEAARLRFFDLLSSSELFVLLDREADGDEIAPHVVTQQSGAYVLAFDRESRLSDFTGRAAPYAALSGRALAGLLAKAGLGMALNLGEAPSAQLLPPEAMSWLATAVGAEPDGLEKKPVAFHPPHGAPQSLLAALDGRLAAASGLARAACLVGVEYSDGSRMTMLAIMDAAPQAEAALVQIAKEALVFCGLEAAALDISFRTSTEEISARMLRVGLRFDIPDPVAPLPPKAPGSDPDKPPLL